MTKQEFKILANGYMDSFVDLCNMDKDLNKYGINFDKFYDKENRAVEQILNAKNRIVCSYLLEIAFKEKEERDKLLEELANDLNLDADGEFKCK